MATASAIKKEMEFHQDFSSLIEILKLLAVSQYYNLEKRTRSFEIFGDTIRTFFRMIGREAIHHPFLDSEKKDLGVVAITSDRGFVGGVNNKIMMIATGYLKNNPGKLIVVGSQGARFMQEMAIPFKGFSGISEENKESLASQLRDYIVNEVVSGKLGGIRVVYPHALSIMVQRIEELTLLPRRAWLKDNPETSGRKNSEILLESSPENILEYLIFLWLEQKFYEILGLAHLAEYAARYLHLEESIQKINEENKKLKFRYFHARHEIIDQQMRELFAAQSIYAK